MKLEEIMFEIPKAPGDAPTFEIQLPKGATYRAAFQHVKQNAITNQPEISTRYVFCVDPDQPMERVRFGHVFPNCALPEELIPHMTYRGTMFAGHPAMPVPISIYTWPAEVEEKFAADAKAIEDAEADKPTIRKTLLRSLPAEVETIGAQGFRFDTTDAEENKP